MTGAMIDFPGAPNPARPDAPAPGTATGYLAVPDGGSGPGIVLTHAWWGLNPTFRGVADRLAANGFVVLAPDLYGDGRFVTTIEEADARSNALDWVRAEQAVLGAADRVGVEPAVAVGKIGTIGFSLGSGPALWLSHQRLEVGAVVLVYSPGEGDYAASRAPVQLHYSPQDAYEDMGYVEAFGRAVREAGRGFESFEYPGVDHWFLEPDRPQYDAVAAEAAWERILAFFGRELGSGT